MIDDAKTPGQESAATEEAAKPLSLLARESFGADFHGTVKEPEQQEEVAGEEVETPEDAAEQVEGEEPESETPDDGETTEEETEEIVSSFSELVDTQEWDWDWVKTLTHSVNVDGETHHPTYSDLIKSYRADGEADKRVAAAKTQAEAITQELTQRQQALEGQFTVAARLIENAEKLIDQDTSQIDWATLRRDDPAEYSARMTEVRGKREEIERMKREAVESYQTATQEQQQEATQEAQKYRAEQQTALLVKLPDWQDEATAKAERDKIVIYLRNEGFDDADIMGATDHRLVVMARKAMLFDEGKAKVNAAKKKVAKVPKTLKPGAPKPQGEINQEQLDKARARLRKSGNIDDAAAVLRSSRT